MQPEDFAKRTSSWAQARTCVTVPGAAGSASDHRVWIESMMTAAGFSVAQGGGGGEMHRRFLNAEAPGAQADLRRRFFAGDIGDACAALGEAGSDLKQERRLADPGIAADQERRAGHQSAAAGAVEFGVAGEQARGFLRRAGQRGEVDFLALGAGRRGQRAWRSGLRGFKLDRVPFPARLAAPGPFSIDRAAGLADIGVG